MTLTADHFWLRGFATQVEFITELDDLEATIIEYQAQTFEN